MSMLVTQTLTSEQLAVLQTSVDLGLMQVQGNVTVQAPKIAMMRPVDVGTGEDPMSRKIGDVLFPMVPPTALPQMIESEDRSFNPLAINGIRVHPQPWSNGYEIKRQDLYRDLYGILRDLPGRLARPMLKLPDIELAKLLRNGKTELDFTGTPAFSTTKPKSVNGAISGTYSNLYTSRSLTAQNVSFGIEQMMARVNEDGLVFNMRPDTLIIPPQLFGAAQQAVRMMNAVFSDGNPWPGQVAGTAARGDNWVAYAGMIKEIVVLPELTIGNAAIDQTTWYLAECQNPERGGPVGLCCAIESGWELLTNLQPNDYSPFVHNTFKWAVERYAGFSFGHTAFLSRFEA